MISRIKFLSELPVLTDEDLNEHQSNLHSLNQFLQGLQVFDTPAKLKNFKKGIDEIRSQHVVVALVNKLTQWRERASQITKKANYLVSAMNHIPITDMIGIRERKWHLRIYIIHSRKMEIVQTSLKLLTS